MHRRQLFALAAFVLLSTAAARGLLRAPETARSGTWHEVVAGVLRHSSSPTCYALLSGGRALLFDLPNQIQLDDIKKQGHEPDLVLLTHHHRHTASGALEAASRRIAVRGPKSESNWLTPDGVARFWQESVPLRSSRTAYFVLEQGIPQIDASLEPGQIIDWRDWHIEILATPGHSPGHLSYAARRKPGDSPIVFCGDAMARPGTIWSPFTLEWDHWTDSGFKPAAESLRRLLELEPAIVCPTHAEPITQNVQTALTRTIAAIEEVAFLKSFERYTDHRLGDAPTYQFLAPEQVATSGDKPWSRLSEHLFITGNTYLLASTTGRTMAIDLWGKRSIDQLRKLVAEHALDMPEVVWVSHAHYDHFDGIYEMPDRSKFQVWTLDRSAAVLEEPVRYRAPFLDPRPIRVDRNLSPGEEVTWQEYRFRVHHLPGQTTFTMGIEATIDGHRALFTADNFFHAKQFSGSGGWTGLNRALPAGYGASARKILEIAPEWILAEHGGPFQFNAEDFRRRVAWAEAAAGACDRLSPSSDHTIDWDPHRISFEPVVISGRPGDSVPVKLITNAIGSRQAEFKFKLNGRRVIEDIQRLPAPQQTGSVTEFRFPVVISRQAPAGRHVFAARIVENEILQGIDIALVVDVTAN